MQYKNAEKYVEALLFAAKDVKRGVSCARQQANKKRREFLGIAARGSNVPDPTAKAAINNVSPLPVVRCSNGNGSFVVVAPEKWLRAIKQAFDLYGSRFGSEALETIRHRYVDGWNVRQIKEVQGISKSLYQQRRTEFLHCLLLYAVQAGIIEIE